uniref:Uncharacterized protein LOC105630437 n=1 Tax=Rhizophora mucronata TaxID=61149 RepID=A0A2P2JMK0_RHIMU
MGCFMFLGRFQTCEAPEEEEEESNHCVVYHQRDDHQIGSSSWSQNSEIDKSNGGENSVVMETGLSASTNKCEFLSGKDISGFLEEPQTFSFTIHEFLADTITNIPVLDAGGSTECDFREVELEQEEEKSEKAGDFDKGSVLDEFSKAKEEEITSEEKSSDKEEILLHSKASDSTDRHRGNIKLDVDDVCVMERKEECVGGLVIQQVYEKEDEETRDKKVNSITNEVSANGTTNDHQFGLKIPVLIDQETAGCDEEPEAGLAEENSADSNEEYAELEIQNQISTPFGRQGSGHEEGEQEMDGPINPEEPSLQENRVVSDSDVQEDPYMFEHEDIVQQLKMELKHARTGGLPTILEESESEELDTPTIVQELKPIKVEEKIEHKDHMEEIQKMYKIYLDKMKKLDILNFQTMHALGLLQLKDAIQSHATWKSTVQAMKSVLFHNLWSCKQGSAVIDPTKKIIADVYREFEIVYVGQTCLSWEILHWQYRKAQELQAYDCQAVHKYNQATGEFQLFQVLVQRFIENEPFEGPRVDNYVKNRCVLRSFLQIPVIKDDNLKDKGKKGDDEDAITSQTLTEIIEQSMRTSWEFVSADKEEVFLFQWGRLQLLDPAYLKLLMDVRTDFQKKDRKLRDILRSGNCIVKKFQKQRQDRMHHTLLVAQVELKLISRVLNLSKLTRDQLIWCQEKLEKIKFCNRKVLVEPSFLLFPC